MALSPDGKELAFTSNRQADEASTTNADLWTVAVDGSRVLGETKPDRPARNGR